jgi:Skp family chaperone for outer membrane proteins
MSRHESFLGVLRFALALAVAAAAVSGARAQSLPQPVIAVLDVDRILRESAASKSMRPQVDKIRSDYQQDVARQEGALRKAEQDLLQQRAVLSAEVFAQKRREFDERARKAHGEVQERKRVVEQALAGAVEKIRTSTIEVATQIASERQINVVLPRAAVLLSVQGLDITGETMRRLDQKLPNVTVEMPKAGTGPAGPAPKAAPAPKTR